MSKEVERVFVTGATGLVGRAVVSRLRERDGAVTASARAVPDDAGADDLVRWVAGDLRELSGWQEQLTGHETLVHCGALVGPGHSAADSMRVNGQGTRELLEAASRAGVEHFVHISSTGVYGYEQGRYGEDDPLTIDVREPYVASKVEAERACQWARTETSMSITVLRPSMIYGASPRGFLPMFASAIGEGKFKILGDGGARMPVVSVDDVAAAVVQVVSTPEARGQTYNIDAEGEATWREVVELIASQVGAAPPKSIPRWVAASVARVAQWISALPGVPPSPLHPVLVEMMTRSYRYDISRAKQTLGLEPTPWAEGITAALSEIASR
ncbi:MAG: NAD(P)-dependent oxidoreductase [Myxococcota bacterium]